MKATSSPQWSPPLNGGSIAINETMQAYGTLPQWSPPLNGGNTRTRRESPGHGGAVAMEPAAERQEHLSPPGEPDGLDVAQWSPPMIGGMTHRVH